MERSMWTWLLVVLACLKAAVDANQQQANNYRVMMTNLRAMVSHPYRDNTAVVRGGRGMSFVIVGALAGGDTNVELILSHRDLYLLGYRVHRTVYLFQDSIADDIGRPNYDTLVRLNFAGDYRSLERYAQQSRQEVVVNSGSLRTGIQNLERNQGTDRDRARTLLALIMIVSEAARFTEIYNSVYNSFNTDATWRASDRHVGMMNSWADFSEFIVDSSMDVTESSTQYFPSIRETLSLRAALGLCAIILRCFQRSRQSRDTTPAKCGIGPSITAAIADGTNQVYLFNGPNFVHYYFTPGSSSDDRLLDGGVKSILQDWSFLKGTTFVKGVHAAFRVPKSSNAYIFRGTLYALIDVPGKKLINGPKDIYDGWPSLRPYEFVKGIDAAFHSTATDEVYLFRGNHYVVVNYAPGTTNDFIVTSPRTLYSSWPSLRPYDFVNGFDAAFARPDTDQAYLFKGNQYLRIKYAPGTTDDQVLTTPRKILDGWPALIDTAFDN